MAVQVICRAYDNEPIVLEAFAIQPKGRAINVRREGSEAYLGWSVFDAFDYDIDDFTRLWEAYCAKESDQLQLKQIYNELDHRPRIFLEILREQEAS